MKVLFTIRASTLQGVQAVYEYLDEEMSQSILPFEHMMSSFNILKRKWFCIGDYVCSVLSCEVFPSMQS